MSEQRHVERMNVVLNRDREGDQRLLAALEALPEGQRMHMCRYLLLKHMPDPGSEAWTEALQGAAEDNRGRTRKRGRQPGALRTAQPQKPAPVSANPTQWQSHSEVTPPMDDEVRGAPKETTGQAAHAVAVPMPAMPVARQGMTDTRLTRLRGLVPQRT
mgnify:CR=1 FL=1